MKNRCRKPVAPAVRKQTAGMATPPTTKQNEAASPDQRAGARPGRQGEEHVHHAQRGQRDVSQPHDPPAERAVSAEEILAVEEQPDDRSGDERGEKQQPAELPVQDVRGCIHDSRVAGRASRCRDRAVSEL